MTMAQNVKSLKRWARQFTFIPFLHNKWLTPAVKDELEYAIAHAESGHYGEICVVIENRLPFFVAYHQDCRSRAIELFSSCRVWDTADNSGILVYVNLCEHRLEIVVDRGIQAKMPQAYWDELCETVLQDFQNGQIKDGLKWLVAVIGDLLRKEYPADRFGNEIPNRPMYFR